MLDSNIREVRGMLRVCLDEDDGVHVSVTMADNDAE